MDSKNVLRYDGNIRDQRVGKGTQIGIGAQVI